MLICHNLNGLSTFELATLLVLQSGHDCERGQDEEKQRERDNRRKSEIVYTHCCTLVDSGSIPLANPSHSSILDKQRSHV